MEQMRFPIGQFEPELEPSPQQRYDWIEEIAAMPRNLKLLVQDLSIEQRQTSYRPGGWTVNQVVHHLADNDMYAYLRFKQALAEDNPAVGAYQEDLWAQLKDYQEPLESSILLLEVVHNRFAALLRNIDSSDFLRTYSSPSFGVMTLDVALQQCAWHDKHHTAQIKSLIVRKGW